MTLTQRVTRQALRGLTIAGRLMQGAWWLGTSTILIGGYVYGPPPVARLGWCMVMMGMAAQMTLGRWPFHVIERALTCVVAQSPWSRKEEPW
jgi:hypothetical protein